MGTLAERATAASVRALVTQDRRLANAIILNDDRIDDLEKQLDRLCLEFLVRQQPVAGHLRFLYSCIKINTELERIGDYAESVARYALDLASEPAHQSFELLTPIGELATRMLREAMSSFLRQDVAQARATLALEREVDALRANIRRKLLELNRSGELPIEALIPLLISAGRYERVADQAANICEEVLYMCTGEFEKHKGREMVRVLFVYRSWSRLGMMAELLATSLGLSNFVFSSAGFEPGESDLRTIEFLATKGIDASRWVPRSFLQIPNLEHYQVVILLDDGMHELRPQLPGKAIKMHWRTPRPPAIDARHEEAAEANERLFRFLDENIRAFVEATTDDSALG
jgi:phosphate transport system protein